MDHWFAFGWAVWGLLLCPRGVTNIRGSQLFLSGPDFGWKRFRFFFLSKFLKIQLLFLLMLPPMLLVHINGAFCFVSKQFFVLQINTSGINYPDGDGRIQPERERAMDRHESLRVHSAYWPKVAIRLDSLYLRQLKCDRPSSRARSVPNVNPLCPAIYLWSFMISQQ